MRRQLNLAFPAPRLDGQSDLYRKFRPIFRILGQPTNPAEDRQEPREWYVRNPPVEEQIDSVLRTDPTNGLWLLLGHTGIGKTTVLSYVCDGHKTAYSPEDGLLRIHISCDPRRITTAEEWDTEFCAILEEASSILSREFDIEWTPLELAEYVQHSSGDVLYLPNLPPGTSLEERLEAVRQEHRRAYQLASLKFLSRSRLKRMCIVIDDLESLPHQIQLSAVEDVFRAHRCLTQNEGPEPCICALIVLRPDTYAALSEGGRLTPYSYDKIHFGAPVGLNDLLQARFDTASKTIAAKIGNPSEWQRCLNVMKEVAGRLDDRFGGTMVWLSNHNVRDALERFTNVLANRKWFQRGAKQRAAFHLEEFDFAVTDAGVIRAMAMPISEMYSDNLTTPVANLLHNESWPRTDLLATYIGRYLCRRAGDMGRSLWMAHDLTPMLDVVDELFPEGQGEPKNRELFEKAIAWMAQRELLFKLDTDGPGREYSLSPRMIQLWRLMERNSLLLQCWREDVWRDLSDCPEYNRPNEQLTDAQRILDCLRFCREVVKAEAEHLRVAQTRNCLPLMRDTFGSNLISRQLLRGLQATRDQFFTDDERMSDKVTTEITNLLDELPALVQANEALLQPVE